MKSVKKHIELHDKIVRYAYLFLTIYYSLLSLNIDRSSFFIKVFLLLGLLVALVAFFLNKEVIIKRFYILSLLVILTIWPVLYFHFFTNSHYGFSFDYTFIFGLCFILAAGSIEVKELIKISFKVKLFILSMAIILSELKFIPNVLLYRDDGGNTIRQSLGFNHPNTLGLFVLCLTLEYIYLNAKRVNIIKWILLVGINTVFYLIDMSRSSFFCALLILCLFILYKYTSIIKSSIFKYFTLLMIPCIFFFSVFFPYSYNNLSTFYYYIDKLFTNRVFMGNFYLENYGFGLFGRPMPNVTFRYNALFWKLNVMLDSSYIRILIQYGLITLIILFVYTMFKIISLFKSSMNIEICLIIVLLIYAIYERYAYNIFLFSIATVLVATPRLNTQSTEEYEIPQQETKKRRKLKVRNMRIIFSKS